MSHIPNHRKEYLVPHFYNFRAPGTPKPQVLPSNATIKKSVPIPQTSKISSESPKSEKSALECKKIELLGAKKETAYQGEQFTQIFRCDNTGVSPWPANLLLHYISAVSTTRMECDTTEPEQVKLNNPSIKPGESYDLILELTAPTDRGSYKEMWQLLDSESKRPISKIISVQIDVN